MPQPNTASPNLMAESYSHLGPVAKLLRFLRGYSWLLIGTVLLILFVIQVISYGQAIGEWDWLLLSGTVTFLCGIGLAQQVPLKMKITLRRLVDRGTLVATIDDLIALEQRLHHTAADWAKKGAIAVALATAASFLSIYGLGNGLLTLLETIGGFIVGWCLGQMSAYGALLRLIRQENLSLRAEPEHTDGVCGFKPLGDFYGFQALVAAVPAIFLALWWVIIPIFPRDYSHWRQPYAGLLAMAIGFEVLVLVVPLVLFHQEMEQQKQHLLIESDRLSRDIVALRSQLIYTDSADQRSEIEARIVYLINRHHKIDQMTTWPIHPQTLRRFTLRNTLLLIPIFSEFVGHSQFWTILKDILTGLLNT